MDKKIWEEQYPEMPELFHLAVEQAVNRAVGNETVYTGQGTVERERSVHRLFYCQMEEFRHLNK